MRISRNNLQCAACAVRAGVQQVQGENLQTEDDGSRISSDTVTSTTSPGPRPQHTELCVLALIVNCDWKLTDLSSSPGPAHMAHRAVWTSLTRTTATAGPRFPLLLLQARMNGDWISTITRYLISAEINILASSHTSAVCSDEFSREQVAA